MKPNETNETMEKRLFIVCSALYSKLKEMETLSRDAELLDKEEILKELEKVESAIQEWQ